MLKSVIENVKLQQLEPRACDGLVTVWATVQQCSGYTWAKGPSYLLIGLHGLIECYYGGVNFSQA